MEKVLVSNIKGAFDAAPDQQALRNRVTGVLRKYFEAYGYMPLETACLNYLSLLTNKYDPDAEIVREIYKLRDQGERDLGLRFDLTVPFAKFIAANQNLRLPFKRYEIGKVWRNGPVKSGRTREFYQCDVDAVGITGAHIEAELISMAVKAFNELGIPVVVKYGNRKLLPYSDAVISVIDKMAKISKEDLVRELSKLMSAGEAERLIIEVTNAPKCAEVLDLERELENLGVLSSCEFAPYLARGLNIYTGSVWEIFAKDGQMTSSLGGGGRYDRIIGNFIGRGDYPAVGTSFGLEPIMAVLKDRGADAQSLIDVMIVPLGVEAFAQKFADTLRAEGRRVLVYLGGKTLGKAFEYASACGIKSVAVVGADEANGKPVTFKEIH
jgi:histidyl-tRNA synthetase